MTTIDGDIQALQARVQQLFDIPLREFTDEHVAELAALDEQAEVMGYERAKDDTLSAVRYVRIGPLKLMWLQIRRSLA